MRIQHSHVQGVLGPIGCVDPCPPFSTCLHWWGVGGLEGRRRPSPRAGVFQKGVQGGSPNPRPRTLHRRVLIPKLGRATAAQYLKQFVLNARQKHCRENQHHQKCLSSNNEVTGTMEWTGLSPRHRQPAFVAGSPQLHRPPALAPGLYPSPFTLHTPKKHVECRSCEPPMISLVRHGKPFGTLP